MSKNNFPSYRYNWEYTKQLALTLGVDPERIDIPYVTTYLNRENIENPLEWARDMWVTGRHAN